LTTKSNQPYIYIKYVFDGQLLNLDIVKQKGGKGEREAHLKLKLKQRERDRREGGRET
jgi:hypothetical protein